jgi:hypothetical protein
MVRNPVDVMYAMHSDRLYSGVEHIANFAVALDSNEMRKWRSGRFKGQPWVRLSYRELVKFSEQIKRFIDIFGRKNVHVIVYDDFARNPGLIYKEVLAFLRVSPDYECGFTVIHANRRIRSAWVQDLLRNPPHTVTGVVRTFIPQPIRHHLRKALHRLNIKVAARRPLDERFRKRLQLEFEPEVQQLSNLLGRDLLNWITG